MEGLVDDDKGFTNLIVQSSKGERILDRIADRYELYATNLEKAIELDGTMICHSAEPHPRRDKYYLNLDKETLRAHIQKFVPIRIRDYKYMIVYSYSVPKEHQAYIKRYARKNNLKLVSICLYQSWCDLNINCHPMEFSSYIRFSECVYTTTFHGTIFTLLNHKKCAIYSCSKKLKDLLEWTHKEETMLSLTATYDEFESLITKQHSYELFETIIEKKRQESQKIYIDALKSCEV